MNNCNSILSVASLLLVGVVAIGVVSCGKEINAVHDKHFHVKGDSLPDGNIKREFVLDTFSIEVPSEVKFYAEVSGSMNGFYRANVPTDFKVDVWEIVNYFSAISDGVTTLTNDGNMGIRLRLPEFQSYLSAGRFVSTASTRVPVMLQSIIDNLDVNRGEVAVLISDMKYDPVGKVAPKVLESMYSTDVSHIFGEWGQAICLVGATSNYVGRSGEILADTSPYYYLILGKDSQVAYMRNAISTLLYNNLHYVENIESGFKYKSPTYSFGQTRYCRRKDLTTPTFVRCKTGMCSISLHVSLENYRWILADTTLLRESFQAKALYGSEVEVGEIYVDIQNITDRQLNRKALATIELNIGKMPKDTEVIEWTLELPDGLYGQFTPFLDDAASVTDLTMSYSVKGFIKGMFYGGVVNQILPNNYILISKN